MSKFLYGAAVQGIQDFIFQTGKLREIAGASELVEQICTSAFDKFAVCGTSVLRAAGNIKYIFDRKEACEKAVLEFPREVMNMAPGITVSQAVVEMKDTDYAKASDELEKRLRAQRNKPLRSMTLGLMAVSRAPSTGLPAVQESKDGLLDEASVKKTKKTDNDNNSDNSKHSDNSQTTKKLMIKMTDDTGIKHKQIAYDFEDLEGKNSWIAVVHADGNGMGRIVQKVCKKSDYAAEFSRLIDEITVGAARAAFNKVARDDRHCERSEAISSQHKGDCFVPRNDGTGDVARNDGADDAHSDDGNVIPLRPVVLGGDDLTLICRADIAVDFVKVYMEEFEKQSKAKFQEAEFYKDAEIKAVVQNGLTVCAGIAFVKSSYPFHYAVELAESLCSRAKKAAKEIDEDLAPSCLMFHKVQDSFVDDFEAIAKKELQPQPNLTFEYGPYYLVETLPAASKAQTISALLGNVEKLDGKEGNAIKSHLRQWLSLLFGNVDAANQKMKRLRKVNSKAADIIPEALEKVEMTEKIPYYDILSLASIMHTETKKGGAK